LFEDIAELQKAVEIEQSTSSAAAITSGGGSSSVLDAYPVGSIYMSVNSTNPGTLFGGTWQAWGAGRVPVGFDSSQSEFDTVEETGGEKTHTLTVAEMPSHTHSFARPSWYIADFVSGGDIYTPNGYKTSKWVTMNTDATGGGGAHNNLQPYITCYMWKRVS
jgi:hypothetical protein